MTDAGKYSNRDPRTFGKEWADRVKSSQKWIVESQWPSGKPLRPNSVREETTKGGFTVGSYKVSDDTFEYNVRKLAEELTSTVVRKQKDYGPNNIRKSPFGPLIGLTVRLYDKIARLANLSTGKKPNNESLRDTFVDIAGYGLIGLMILDGTFPDPKE